MKYKFIATFIAGIAVAVMLIVAIPNLDNTKVEAKSSSEWSPTKPYPKHEVYFPGTEELAPDEMRVIACGTGMPMPRLKQAAACFLIELGNGEKFIFDLGTGAFTTLYALGMPLDYMTKIFLTHQHADHMGDLPTFFIYGMQNGRTKTARGVGTRWWWYA